MKKIISLAAVIAMFTLPMAAKADRVYTDALGDAQGVMNIGYLGSLSDTSAFTVSAGSAGAVTMINAGYRGYFAGGKVNNGAYWEAQGNVNMIAGFTLFGFNAQVGYDMDMGGLSLEPYAAYSSLGVTGLGVNIGYNF